MGQKKGGPETGPEIEGGKMAAHLLKPHWPSVPVMQSGRGAGASWVVISAARSESHSPPPLPNPAPEDRKEKRAPDADLVP